jgi:hypothetical protein
MKLYVYGLYKAVKGFTSHTFVVNIPIYYTVQPVQQVFRYCATDSLCTLF